MPITRCEFDETACAAGISTCRHSTVIEISYWSRGLGSRLRCRTTYSITSRIAVSHILGEIEPRYAIYFVPAPESKLYRFGRAVLGYDCYTGMPVDFPQQFGTAAVNWNEITAAPRPYGFHATLKAPFRLSPSCTERQLINALENFARLGHAVHSFAPTVRPFNGFIAVVPVKAEPALDSLAASCTTLFDAYRAPMSPQERARRIALGLNQSQIQNLDRWGHPYVMSEFRFHMTLTGSVPPRRRNAIVAALLDGFHRMNVESSIAVDQLALMKQDSPADSFEIVSRCALGAAR